METSDFILYIGLMIFISHLFTSFFKTTKVPDVLLLILLGILVNIFGFDPTPFFLSGDILFEIALALILFEAGIHLKFNDLYTAIKSSVTLILSTYILTVLVLLLFCHYILLFSFLNSLFLGFIMASISPAVVIPLSDSMSISETTKSNLIIESTLTDVLSIFFVVTLIGYNSNYQDLSISTFFKDLMIIFIKSFGVGLLAALLWSYIFQKIRNLPNTIFTSLAFIFILFGISHYINTSGPITVLFFSMTISIPTESKIRSLFKKISVNLIEFTKSEKSFYSEIIFIIKTFFFIFLGIKMSYFQDLELSLIALFYLKAILLTSILFFIRYLSIKLTKPNLQKHEMTVLLSMIPKGLAAAVLISFYVNQTSLNITLSQELVFTTYGVILISILVSSILVYISEKQRKKYLLTESLKVEDKDSIEEEIPGNERS